MQTRRFGVTCIGVTLFCSLLCATSLLLWWQDLQWHYCWFPPDSPQIEVVISACVAPDAGSFCCLPTVSPDGRQMLYSARGQARLNDLITGRETPSIAIGQFWLGDNLVLIGNEPPDFWILNVAAQRKTKLQWVQGVDGTIIQLPDGTVQFTPKVLEWFRRAQVVYYIPNHIFSPVAIACASNCTNDSEDNFVLAVRHTYSPNDAKADQAIDSFLKDNSIQYKQVNGPNPQSHNGQFLVKLNAFFTKDGREIQHFELPFHSYQFAGWAHDDSGVYVYIPEVGSIFFPSPSRKYPILKINLPKEYLSPTARQREEARQAQRQAEETRTTVLVSAAGILLGGAVFGIWWRRKREGR